LQAHGKKEGSVGGVDAAFACHPSLVAIPGDFDPVTKPLSLALGTKDSLLDEKQSKQIQESMSKKTDVESEIKVCRVSHPRLCSEYRLTAGSRSMKIKSTGSLYEAIGAVRRTRKPWTTQGSRASAGSRGI